MASGIPLNAFLPLPCWQGSNFTVFVKEHLVTLHLCLWHLQGCNSLKNKVLTYSCNPPGTRNYGSPLLFPSIQGTCWEMLTCGKGHCPDPPQSSSDERQCGLLIPDFMSILNIASHSGVAYEWPPRSVRTWAEDKSQVTFFTNTPPWKTTAAILWWIKYWQWWSLYVVNLWVVVFLLKNNWNQSFQVF